MKNCDGGQPMSEKAGLYQKMLAVMQDVQYLRKDDTIAYKSTRYKGISEEKVTSVVGESLRKHGLVVFPVEQTNSLLEKPSGKDRVDYLTTVDVKYKIVDAETGQSEIIVSSGTGVDSQDKGIGKAMTYAYKYLFLRSFAIPTGEDPDKISSAELDDQQEHRQKKTQSKTKRSTSKQAQGKAGSSGSTSSNVIAEIEKIAAEKNMIDKLETLVRIATTGKKSQLDELTDEEAQKVLEKLK